MNAIGQTIADVEQRIQQLQELHASLVKLVPLLSTVPLPEETTSAPTPATAKRMVKTLKKVKRGPYKTRKAKGPASPITERQLGERPGVVPSPAAAKARAGNPTTQALLDGKADIVPGAIKQLLRNETAPFTKEELRDNLLEDPYYKQLLEAEGGTKSFENALYNWSGTGKLKLDGENYTVTAAGKEWFNK